MCVVTGVIERERERDRQRERDEVARFLEGPAAVCMRGERARRACVCAWKEQVERRQRAALPPTVIISQFPPPLSLSPSPSKNSRCASTCLAPHSPPVDAAAPWLGDPGGGIGRGAGGRGQGGAQRGVPLHARARLPLTLSRLSLSLSTETQHHVRRDHPVHVRVGQRGPPRQAGGPGEGVGGGRSG